MFTLIVKDQAVYERLMARAAQHGGSIDQALQDLLDRAPAATDFGDETPASKLMRLIDSTDLPFEHPFNARDAEMILTSKGNFLNVLP